MLLESVTVAFPFPAQKIPPPLLLPPLVELPLNVLPETDSVENPDTEQPAPLPPEPLPVRVQLTSPTTLAPMIRMPLGELVLTTLPDRLAFAETPEIEIPVPLPPLVTPATVQFVIAVFKPEVTWMPMPAVF